MTLPNHPQHENAALEYARLADYIALSKDNVPTFSHIYFEVDSNASSANELSELTREVLSLSLDRFVNNPYLVGHAYDRHGHDAINAAYRIATLLGEAPQVVNVAVQTDSNFPSLVLEYASPTIQAILPHEYISYHKAFQSPGYYETHDFDTKWPLSHFMIASAYLKLKPDEIFLPNLPERREMAFLSRMIDSFRHKISASDSGALINSNIFEVYSQLYRILNDFTLTSLEKTEISSDSSRIKSVKENRVRYNLSDLHYSQERYDKARDLLVSAGIDIPDEPYIEVKLRRKSVAVFYNFYRGIITRYGHLPDPLKAQRNARPNVFTDELVTTYIETYLSYDSGTRKMTKTLPGAIPSINL